MYYLHLITSLNKERMNNMKFTPQSRYKKTGKPMSYHIILGSKEARDLGFVNEKGKIQELFYLNVNNTLTIAPVTQRIRKLSYKGYETEVLSNGRIFFGSVGDKNWFATKEDRAEAQFQSTVNAIIAEQLEDDTISF